MVIFSNGFTYLNTNRTQAVNMSLHLSHNITVISRIPQCSHLGPLVFLILIDHLPRFVLESFNITQILLFADYAKLKLIKLLSISL